MEITSHKLTGIVAGSALLLAAASIWHQIRYPGPRLNHTPFLAAGQVLARETAQAIQDRGQIVVVLDDQSKVSGSPLRDEWQTFQKELRNHDGVTIAATEVYVPDPHELYGMTSRGCSMEAFRRILEQHAQAAAIVFFIELPEWYLMKAHSQIPAPGAAAIIALDNQGTPVRKRYGDYFANGLLSVLVWARGGPLTPSAAKTPQQWAEQMFAVYTLRNYESIPRE